MKVNLNTSNIYSRGISCNNANPSFGSTNNAIAQGITEINNTSKFFNKKTGILAAITAGIVAFGYYIFKPDEDKIVHPSSYKA